MNLLPKIFSDGKMFLHLANISSFSISTFFDLQREKIGSKVQFMVSDYGYNHKLLQTKSSSLFEFIATNFFCATIFITYAFEDLQRTLCQVIRNS